MQKKVIIVFLVLATLLGCASTFAAGVRDLPPTIKIEIGYPTSWDGSPPPTSYHALRLYHEIDNAIEISHLTGGPYPVGMQLETKRGLYAVGGQLADGSWVSLKWWVLK